MELWAGVPPPLWLNTPGSPVHHHSCLRHDWLMRGWDRCKECVLLVDTERIKVLSFFSLKAQKRAGKGVWFKGLALLYFFC